MSEIEPRIALYTLLFCILYLLPGLLAAFRKHPYLRWIFLLNIFLGWTVLGWVGALVWATSSLTNQIRGRRAGDGEGGHQSMFPDTGGSHSGPD